jgi:hypothetical protein
MQVKKSSGQGGRPLQKHQLDQAVAHREGQHILPGGILRQSILIAASSSFSTLSSATAGTSATTGTSAAAGSSATAAGSSATRRFIRAGPGLIHGECSSPEFLFIKASDRCLRFSLGGHLDETKSFRFTSKLIFNNGGGFDLAECLKSAS